VTSCWSYFAGFLSFWSGLRYAGAWTSWSTPQAPLAGAARVFMAGPAAIPAAEWQDSLDINFLSSVRTVNAVLPALRESGAGGPL
jgi:NAD(P)-dependent dehydrogenase (short-subunit alcohol dehydrogenase family)